MGRAWAAAVGVCLLLQAGCNSPEAAFHFNAVYAHKQSGVTKSQAKNVKEILIAQFGTPDEPAIPALPDMDVSSVISLDRLKMSAGPVERTDDTAPRRGLYREHCAHCHGVTGDGRGPTARFLNPYPRDYRRGTSKFKSTPVGGRPTHADLKRILVDGIPGTAMPSFKLLAADELESLIQYVKYLAIRGEVERSYILEIDAELEEEDLLLNVPGEDAEQVADQVEVIQDITSMVLSRWANAAGQATEVPSHPVDDDKLASITRGRELFFGTTANCVKCHGDTALGDGQTTDYDEWTKEIDPTKPHLAAEYVALGAFTPRNIRPRNLRQGVYRGGRRPVDIYWRIKNGIEGTPMPAAPATLRSDDIWHLVDYVRSLPYEALSEGRTKGREFQRERN